MKKLMIAAAIVCAAVLANAASCEWNTYASDATGDISLDNCSYWLVSLGDTSTGFDSLKVMNDGTVDFGSYSYTSGKVPADVYGLTSGVITDLTTSDNGNYYAFVVVDAANAYYGKSLGQISGITETQPANAISFDNSGMGWGMTMADTATEAVPEPTSGLLLLLGVAGLALRRRRA